MFSTLILLLSINCLMPWFLEWNDVPFFDIINATKNQHYFKVENYVRQHVDIRCRYQEHFD
jgi:hypothetical protein